MDDIGYDVFEGIKSRVRDALLESWIAQGHYETGAVVDSIEYTIERTFDRTSFIAYMAQYGVVHETGVAAADIPFTPGSGARRSAYIEGLIAWVQRRIAVADLREAKSVAFAIAHTQIVEGMPTRTALTYSTTLKRTGWIEAAFEKHGDALGSYIRQFTRDWMETSFTNMILQYKQKL